MAAALQTAWKGWFEAMASPCEVLLDTDDEALAERLFAVVVNEAQRVEAKFSRYRAGNVVARINSSDGRPVEVDEETAHLLDYADQCYRLSDGLFDITTGVLRRAWTFRPQGSIPSDKTLRDLQALVGWEKAIWKNRQLVLQPGMEIDLGGIGKEYAVDRALGLVRAISDVGLLINFGGDIAARKPRRIGDYWTVGIEQIDANSVPAHVIHLAEGALTTSGDSKKFLLHNGRRYGHILHPKTGYPVEDAPRAVTVGADTCTEAGFLSTLGMLKGKEAETFFESAGVRYWITRAEQPKPQP